MASGSAFAGFDAPRPEIGGGSGGLLHTLRDDMLRYTLGNGRSDTVTQTDYAGALT